MKRSIQALERECHFLDRAIRARHKSAEELQWEDKQRQEQKSKRDAAEYRALPLETKVERHLAQIRKANGKPFDWPKCEQRWREFEDSMEELISEKDGSVYLIHKKTHSDACFRVGPPRVCCCLQHPCACYSGRRPITITCSCGRKLCECAQSTMYCSSMDFCQYCDQLCEPQWANPINKANLRKYWPEALSE